MGTRLGMCLRNDRRRPEHDRLIAERTGAGDPLPT
jgi:hypothetical protein